MMATRGTSTNSRQRNSSWISSRHVFLFFLTWHTPDLRQLWDRSQEWHPVASEVEIGGHLEGTAKGHSWLKNNRQWVRNTIPTSDTAEAIAEAGCSMMYRMTGANGPCANLVDGQMHTLWYALFAP